MSSWSKVPSYFAGKLNRPQVYRKSSRDTEAGPQALRFLSAFAIKNLVTCGGFGYKDSAQENLIK